MIVRGEISNHTPTVRARLGRGNILGVGQPGSIAFVVDTGFTGGISVTEGILRRLNPDFIGFDTCMLATGDEVELPIFLGEASVRGRRIETSFVLGENLLGMEFLAPAFDDLRLDLRRHEVRMTTRGKTNR